MQSVKVFVKALSSLMLGLGISGSCSAFACPSIAGIPDFNCDGDLVITILGDSIPAGVGDSKHGNRGGYVLRSQAKLPQVDFQNFGKPGLFAFELMRQLPRIFSSNRENSLKSSLLRADIVILDVGRNDRWLFGFPSQTYRNLKRSASFIKSHTEKIVGYSPLIVTAVLMLPNRGSQGPWVKELNSYILKGSSLSNPADLRFDLVSKRLLSEDQIHPTPKGYDDLSKVLVTYLTKTLPPRMRKLRSDTDADGIFDLFENLRFGTNPNLADTDGDGITDGEEVFTLGSDPLQSNILQD